MDYYDKIGQILYRGIRPSLYWLRVMSEFVSCLVTFCCVKPLSCLYQALAVIIICVDGGLALITNKNAQIKIKVQEVCFAGLFNVPASDGNSWKGLKITRQFFFLHEPSWGLTQHHVGSWKSRDLQLKQPIGLMVLTSWTEKSCVGLLCI